MRARIIPFLLVVSLATVGNGLAQRPSLTQVTSPVVRAEKYYRTELYMGRSVPGGGVVSDEAWEAFLNDVVTPLFPDGFTILVGRGQYREVSGSIAKEPSNVLVFLYRKADRKLAEPKIEKIRAEYKKRFAQESVLRVDITRSVQVSF